MGPPGFEPEDWREAQSRIAHALESSGPTGSINAT